MVTVRRFASALIANLPAQQETDPSNTAYPSIKEPPLETELVWSIVRTAAMKSRKPICQKGTFSTQTNAENCCRAANEARVSILCVTLVGIGKVLLR